MSGHVDIPMLSQLAAALLRGPASPTASHAADRAGAGAGQDITPGQRRADDRDAARHWRATRAAREIILRHAAEIMSGPGGLASYLRTGPPENIVASVSLPLDIGAATEAIPVHLRRAVTARDRRCRFPGCDQPVAACQPHHILPRAKGAPPA